MGFRDGADPMTSEVAPTENDSLTDHEVRARTLPRHDSYSVTLPTRLEDI
jgi:hypothetical protein